MNHEYYENYIKTKLGIPIVNFSGLEEEVIKEIVIGLEECCELFPVLKNVICSVGEIDNIINECNLVLNAKEFTKYKNKDIILDESYIFLIYIPSEDNKFQYIAIGYNKNNFINVNLANKYVIDSARTNYHPKDCITIRSMIFHEIGHILELLLDLQNDKKFFEIIKDLNNNYELICNKISEYAAFRNRYRGNISDIIAEAFSEYMYNKNANEYINAIGIYIEKKSQLFRNKWYNYNKSYKKHLIRAKLLKR